MSEALNITTTNVLHPRQVVDLNETKARLEGILGAAPFIRNQLQDGGALVAKQIGELDKMLAQAPRAFSADEIDGAVKLEAELRQGWMGGMPTQAEMRRNPPGAVDKNMAWERRSKTKILQWKQLRRRLHASGVSEHRLPDEGDISNIEMYRPVGGSAEMNMDNAQIPGADMHIPPEVGVTAVMSEEQSEVLRAVNPELADKMALLDNEARAKVLELVDGLIQGTTASPAPKKPRSEKQLANDIRLGERAKARNKARLEEGDMPSQAEMRNAAVEQGGYG